MSGPKPPGVREKESLMEGKAYRWDPETNEFGTKDLKTGKIITYCGSSIRRDGTSTNANAKAQAEVPATKPSWLEFVDNPEVVRAVYGGQAVPELDGVTVREISWHWDGPSVHIRFDLPTYPDVPPREWRESRFDTAQVELRLLDAAAALEAGLDSDPVGSINLGKGAAAPVHLTLDAERFRARMNARRAVIHRLSGYRQSKAHDE
ncbi:Imm50 family immunity protein [Streptomyces sp. H34-S4]|uniref:Imm50 family immunity protein n=1 Tax=Streptomyces sp. H34-S4 TaxID=2996463 RepID=UPI003B633DCC